MGEKLLDGECYREGIRYGHEWICHMVKLVKAAAGNGMAVGLTAGQHGMGGKSVGSRQRLRTIAVTFEMEKEPYGNGGEGGDCYRGNEKIKIIFL